MTLCGVDLFRAVIDGPRLAGADLRRAEVSGLDLRRLAGYQNVKITADQQFRLLDALGVEPPRLSTLSTPIEMV